MKEGAKDTFRVIEGCLLGCAVGDSVGLPFEGVHPGRVSRWLKTPLEHRLLFGKGMVSDDTDHSVFVAQSLLLSPDDSSRFSRFLAARLRRWLICLPAGIGMATLKSILKLCMGFGVDRSGVFSAGNGPAMRAAIIGVFFRNDDDALREFVRAATRLTHTDPKAELGALAVALIASRCCQWEQQPTKPELEDLLLTISKNEDWREMVGRTMMACTKGEPSTAVTEKEMHKGVSGYVYNTLPPAIAAWWIHFGDYRRTIEAIVRMGGDTDTVAAIAGALAGTSVGRDGIPNSWISGIIDRPHSPAYLSRLANALTEKDPPCQLFDGPFCQEESSSPSLC